jgi:UDP-3-O-[3-hydroxymyristoyl] glucosamine N-acyltransferase
MQFAIDKIVELLQGKCEMVGNTSLTFDNAKPIHEANEKSIGWIANEKTNKTELVANTAARILICNEVAKDFYTSFPEKCFVIVDDPRLSFIRIVADCFSKKPTWGIHPSAVIHHEAVIHPETVIGPNCVIGKAAIGQGSIIDGNVFIYDNVTIGKNVFMPEL